MMPAVFGAGSVTISALLFKLLPGRLEANRARNIEQSADRRTVCRTCPFV